MARPNCKQAILDAAETIVLESGGAHMSLDAVAERTKISKGGLMYNFPTKEALILAMIARLMERMDELREKARRELESTPHNELMVELKLFMDLTDEEYRSHAALLAVVANRPDLMNAFDAKHRQRFSRIIAGSDPSERPSILFFAALGLHFHKLLGMAFLDDKEQQKVYEELMRLAGGEEKI